MLVVCVWKCSKVRWFTCLNGMRHAGRLCVEVFKGYMVYMLKWYETCWSTVRGSVQRLNGLHV
jgi:hypothetical protein